MKINGYGEMYDFSENNAPWVRCDVRNIIFSNEITKIGNWAFAKQKNIAHIEFPDKLTYIGTYAFYECGFDCLEIYFPKSLKEIKDYAFSKSTIRIIHIQGRFSIIHYNAFSNTSLTQVYSDENSIAEIGSYAFANSNLANPGLMNGVLHIRKNAYADCSKMTYVGIPGHTEVEPGAFNGCSNIEKIVIGYNAHLSEENVFGNCNKLRSLEIGDAVIYFSAKTFNCTNFVDSAGTIIKDKKELVNHSFKKSNDLLVRDGGPIPTPIPENNSDHNALIFTIVIAAVIIAIIALLAFMYVKKNKKRE